MSFRKLPFIPNSYPYKPFEPQPLYLPLDEPGAYEPLPEERERKPPQSSPGRVIIIELT